MNFIKNIIKSFLLRRNCVLSRPPGQFSVDQTKYEALRRRGAIVRTAIDGGAANGGWAKMIKNVFPEIKLICVEPRRDAIESLNKWARGTTNVVVSACLLGDSVGEIEYNESRDQSSILNFAGDRSYGKKSRAFVSTIDKIVAESSFPPPDLIKLDLQGYELTALQGAEKCLRECEFVELELSFFPFQEKQPVFAEVVRFMDEAGFRLYDCLGLWHRPLDGALGQGDFLFVSNKSVLLKNSNWDKTAC